MKFRQALILVIARLLGLRLLHYCGRHYIDPGRASRKFGVICIEELCE